MSIGIHKRIEEFRKMEARRGKRRGSRSTMDANSRGKISGLSNHIWIRRSKKNIKLRMSKNGGQWYDEGIAETRDREQGGPSLDKTRGLA